MNRQATLLPYIKKFNFVSQTVFIGGHSQFGLNKQLHQSGYIWQTFQFAMKTNICQNMYSNFCYICGYNMSHNMILVLNITYYQTICQTIHFSCMKSLYCIPNRKVTDKLEYNTMTSYKKNEWFDLYKTFVHQLKVDKVCTVFLQKISDLLQP